jgi:LmbE family N-acetylglucosaminyl deacetylase
MGEDGMSDLTKKERTEIAEILGRRANEIAGFYDEYRRESKHYGSVELALDREIDRLRRLAERVDPEEIEDES